ncbi:TPA: hypothetical protein HA241_02410 [Candidatus Woesearchaeota archaeon]|nr:hypothetical protein [Candidatus Woesearchaeota archaeon]
MGYINLETEGELLSVSPMGGLERKTSDLIFPERTPVTAVLIQGPSCQWSKMVYETLPEEYVGQEVRLLETYLTTEVGILFMQELYVSGERVLNTVIVRTNAF